MAGLTALFGVLFLVCLFLLFLATKRNDELLNQLVEEGLRSAGYHANLIAADRTIENLRAGTRLLQRNNDRLGYEVQRMRGYELLCHVAADNSLTHEQKLDRLGLPKPVDPGCLDDEDTHAGSLGTEYIQSGRTDRT